jgi:hypothetical protein
LATDSNTGNVKHGGEFHFWRIVVFCYAGLK